MVTKIVALMLCLVISDSYQELRVKRAKYFSSPPQRFYRRPPISYPVIGAYSYTPPPNYMDDDEPSKLSKLNKRQNQGLGDEDINNIVKYLSKEELNKVIEFAGEKLKRDGPERIPNKYVVSPPDDGGKFNYNGPYKQQERPIENNNNTDQTFSFYSNNRQSFDNNQPQQQSNFDQTRSNNPMTFLNDYIKNEINSAQNVPNTLSNSREEDRLPKPVNLREDYYYESSNNVPRVIRADNYKLENFGDLPLMNYNSKLDKVSSYKVPHYSVISPKSYGPSAPVPPLEPAPTKSVAQAQSDAHLKAVRIWTHRSTGAAYTLHNDGSLSPERPKNVYGYP